MPSPTFFCGTLFLLLAIAAAEENDEDAQRANTNGVCSYLDYDDGIKMDTLVPECHDKCSMSGKAKNEYDCLNGADGDQCCRWDDNLELKDCKADAVKDELYRAADACCDEATESCSDDGWPKKR